MDFVDRLRGLGDRIASLRDKIATEEATKHAFVLPFIQALGYEIFDPTEVIPEYTADVGIKKGEKIDYAISQNDQIIILMECKHHGAELGFDQMSQLYRYFSVVKARIAILTNGIEYWFYSDMDEANKLDKAPFMRLNLLELKDPHVAELKKMRKGVFDVDRILDAASDLKYRNEIKAILSRELEDPSEEFIRFFASQIYTGRITQNVKDQWKDLVHRAFNQFISDRLTGRLQAALHHEKATQAPEDDDNQAVEETEEEREARIKAEKGIVTTEEELEAFHICKAILAQVTDVERIQHRDTKSYFNILLDDNNRKPLARFYFNTSQKYVAVFDAEKEETKHPIESLNEIYHHADAIRAMVEVYDADE